MPWIPVEIPEPIEMHIIEYLYSMRYMDLDVSCEINQKADGGYDQIRFVLTPDESMKQAPPKYIHPGQNMIVFENGTTGYIRDRMLCTTLCNFQNEVKTKLRNQ